MRVLYDFQIFLDQKIGGISRYHCELVKGSSNRISLIYSENLYLNKNEFSPFIKFFFKFHFFGKSTCLHLLNFFYNIYSILKSDFDVFHPTYYNPYFLLFCKRPFVITVHDLIHEKYYSNFLSKNKFSRIKKKYLYDKVSVLNKSSRIIAISNSTKNDIINYYNISESKIDVIYHGVSENFMLFEILDLKLPARYVLFVGSRNTYKNFSFFIKAMKIILENDPSLFVVCSGQPFTHFELDMLTNLKLRNRFFSFNASELELPTLYAKSSCFVFPSAIEGFGMPILEAFSTNTPCLLSDIACFREVADDAAIFFRLDDFEDFKVQISKILYSTDIRNDLLLKSSLRVKYFSWSKTLELTNRTYLKALSSYEV